jgi:hypothetical protein
MTAVDQNVLEPASFTMQSNVIEGIPIKKRRFLIPKEEPASIDNSSFGIPIKKRRFPAPSPQDHMNDLEIADGNDAVKDPLLEVKKENTVDANLARCQSNLVEDVISKCDSEPISSTIEPNLSIVQDSMGQDREVGQHHMKIFLNRSKNIENIVNSDDSDVTASRSNWDLNTTMDAWGGSGSSSANMPFDETAKPDSVADSSSKNVVNDVHTKSEPTQNIDKSTSIFTEPSSDDTVNKKRTGITVAIQGCANVGEVQDSHVNDDDEKVNLSTDMLEEDVYASASESDGHTMKGRCCKKEEEIEDGEILESLPQTKLDVQIDSVVGVLNVNQDQVEEENYNIEERTSDKGNTFQEPSAVEVGPVVPQAETRLDGEDLSDGGDKGTKTEIAVGEVRNENAEKVAIEDEEREVEYSDSSSNGKHDIAEEHINISGGGKRFIDLSPTKTRYSDFEEDRVHLQRNRDEEFTDGPRRFTRDRFRDESFSGSRPKFGRGRGRAHTRFERSERVSSDRKFNSDNYGGPPEYRFSRNKYPEDFESNGYSDFEGSGRGGRMILRDDFPSFRNVAPRGRGFQMVRRVVRNISPNGDKFHRSFPDDIADPMFARHRISNERFEDQFPRNDRKWGLPPNVRSKSPVRIRRLRDGYNRRSPQPIYRARSPPLSFRPSSEFQRPDTPNRRRFEMNEGEFYEHGPIHAKRFDEFDDRRRGGGNFRPFRVGPKADTEFVDRNNNNSRDRDFDRRIKSRPVIAPSRRIRGVEYEEGGADWHDDQARDRRRRF